MTFTVVLLNCLCCSPPRSSSTPYRIEYKVLIDAVVRKVLDNLATAIDKTTCNLNVVAQWSCPAPHASRNGNPWSIANGVLEDVRDVRDIDFGLNRQLCRSRRRVFTTEQKKILRTKEHL